MTPLFVLRNTTVNFSKSSPRRRYYFILIWFILNQHKLRLSLSVFSHQTPVQTTLQPLGLHLSSTFETENDRCFTYGAPQHDMLFFFFFLTPTEGAKILHHIFDRQASDVYFLNSSWKFELMSALKNVGPKPEGNQSQRYPSGLVYSDLTGSNI